jgi:Ca2+-binding RTX toxin-like protein
VVRRALLAGAALVVGVGGTQYLTPYVALAGVTYGPPYDFPTELMGDGGGLDGTGVIPLKNQAMISLTDHGYRYRSGQQDGHLVVTLTDEGLHLADTGTASFRSLDDGCRPLDVATGVAAVCTMPEGVTESAPLLLEVWPRLGDDHTDGSSLPATVAMAVLADAGDDVVRLGAGPDFVNGAQDRDRIYGGSGNDWLRGGAGNDAVHGGAGADRMVSTDGRDTLFGGDGDDLMYGGGAQDKLYAGPGTDLTNCGPGGDYARVDRADRTRACETVDRR